jgi:chromosome partitioning protein
VIVTVANRKGGVGKTTTGVFLAHALAQATGAPCVIVDADPQGSAARWSQLAAEAGRPLAVPVLARPTPRLDAMVPDVPNVVIDTPPADPDIVAAAINVADIVLIPTSTSGLDLSCVQGAIGAAARRGKPAAVLLNRTRRTRSLGAAEDDLRNAGMRVLRTHIPLREALAMAFGQPVRQLHGFDLAAAELLGDLPEQPYSVEAVRQRALADYRKPLPPVTDLAALGKHRAAAPAPPSRTSGFNEDEIVRRLQLSMARLATQR